MSDGGATTRTATSRRRGAEAPTPAPGGAGGSGPRRRRRRELPPPGTPLFAALATVLAEQPDVLPLTVGLRRLCGIAPHAWVEGAYEQGEALVAYEEARKALEEAVARRAGTVASDVWATDPSRRPGDLAGLCDELAAERPMLVVPPPAVLRPGCDPSKPATLKRRWIPAAPGELDLVTGDGVDPTLRTHAIPPVLTPSAPSAGPVTTPAAAQMSAMTTTPATTPSASDTGPAGPVADPTRTAPAAPAGTPELGDAGRGTPAELVAAARNGAGLTLSELAKRSGVARTKLVAYEEGRTAPTLATLQRILAATGHRLCVAPLPPGP